MSSLESTKIEVRQNATRQSNRKFFTETHDALRQTLTETYTSCSPIAPATPDLVNRWHAEMQPHASKVATQDKTLMLANVSVLLELNIPQLWLDNQFTPTSQRYVWMYLGNLCRFAAAAVESGQEPTTVDIRPPAQLPGTTPGIQQIYDEMPPNMLNKVRNIAEKYSADIENGNSTIEDIKFDDISKELFSQIDPKEMQQMVTSVGAMLQGAMQNGDGDMGELFKMFSRQAV
jgi:hypothetical protein